MNELKDKVYELEGLLELLALRPDKSDDLRHLIEGRIKDIDALWAGMSGMKPETPVKAEGMAAKSEEIVIVEDPPEPVEETPQEPEEQALYNVPEDLDDMDVSMTDTEPEEEMVRDLSDEFEAPAYAPANRPVPALCLNDRYRFIRVIAGGDRVKFDAMLRQIAELPDYESARDYVLSQSHADTEDPEVLDFLEILQQYYE